MVLAVQVKGAEKLRVMAEALRKADREDLRRGMDRAIRKATKPTVRDIQDAAERIKTEGQRKPGAKRRFVRLVAAHGTRRKIADAVAAEVSTARADPRVSFRVRSSRLPANLRNMPRKFDAGVPWRHPVMGHREVWVSQTADPWFFDPIKKNLNTFRDAIDEQLDIVRASLEAA